MNRSRLLETVAANRCLLLTLVVALVLRLGFAVAVQERVDRPPARLCLIPGDADGYWELAQNIVAGRDYAIYQPPRHVLRVPGFPLLLAVSQWLFGENPFAARCLLACVGTAACWLTYWLGRELVDSTTGLIAAMYTAISPTLVLFSVLILSETAFAATLLLSLIAIARLAKATEPVTSLMRASLAGVLIAVATLVRPTWLYVGVALAVATMITRQPRSSLRSYGLSFGGLLCGIVVSMAPWTIRNFYATGHFIPTTLWVGPSLYDGLNPTATGDSDMQFIEDDKLRLHMNEYEIDREYRRRAWDYVMHNPGRTAWLAVKKQQRYWSLFPNASQFQDRRLQVVVCLTALPLLVLGVWGSWISRRNYALVILTAGPILLFAALHLLFVGSLRYRLPAEYPLAVAAAVGFRPLLAAFLGYWHPPNQLPRTS